MHAFTAQLDKIGINPFVFVPPTVLNDLFIEFGKDKGKIPITGCINDKKYTQTLVKYAGEWRLYVNTQMLQDSPNRIGEELKITISIDREERVIAPHPKLIAALEKNKTAQIVFNRISPSLRLEIIRYISFLKTEKSIELNIGKVIDFLSGKGRFIGRELTQEKIDKILKD